MSYRTTLSALAVMAAVTLASGCSDTPELRMEQAKIAFANGKLDESLKLATSVLEEQPDNFEAMTLKAQSQMLLAQINSSKKTLDKMMSIRPEDEAVRRMLVDWTWAHIRNLMNQSDFGTNEKLHEQFGETLTLGLEQCDWLAEKPEAIADSLYFRARYTNLDAAKIRIISMQQQRSLQGLSLDENVEDPSAALTEKYKYEVESRISEAEQYLRQALEHDPKHFQAAEMYISMLTNTQKWPDLWDLAAKCADAGEMPDNTAGQLVQAVLSIPGTLKKPSERIEIGRKIQDAVIKDQHESPTWLITSARLNMVAKEYVLAQELLTEALKSRPRDMDGRYLLAQSLYGQEKYEESIAVLEELKRSAPRAARVHALFGLALMQSGDMILAKEALRMATELNPADPMAREGFLALMVQEGHIAEAQKDVEVYYNLNPTQPRAIRFKMQFELANANREEVIKLLKNVEKIKPLKADHLAILIDGYMATQDHRKAVRYAKSLVRERPEELQSHLRLAEALLMEGKDNEVRQMLVALREQFPNSVSVEQMLGRLYLQRQSFDLAIELLEGVVDREPTNVSARLLLAQAFASLSMTDDAIEQIDQALEQDPNNINAHALASRIYQYTGKTEKANQHLDAINQDTIDERNSPALLAQVLIKRGDMDEALAVCNRAVAAGNADPVLRLLLAGIYRARDDADQVETHLLALVHAQPKNPQAFALLSRFYMDQKEIKKGLIQLQALQTLNEALARLAQASLLRAVGQPDAALIKLEPIYTSLIRQRDNMALSIADAMATIHSSKKQSDQAYAVYEPMMEADLLRGEVQLRRFDMVAEDESREALIERLDNLAASLTPQQRRLRYEVMQRYVRLRKPARALAYLEDWILEQKDHPMLYRWKGELLMSLGRPQDAITVLQKAVEMAPQSVGMRLRLADAYISSFDHPEAEAVYREATKLDPGAKITSLAGLGHMYVALGLHKAATETFKELETLSRPRDPRITYAMAQALVALGQDDQAVDRLKDIPNYAPQYAAGQILQARIEQSQSKTEEASDRLKRLVRDPRTASSAAMELLTLNARDPQVEDMLAWCDAVLSDENLPTAVRVRWLGIRAWISANKGDWLRVLEASESMSRLRPESLKYAMARIVTLQELQKYEQSRILYRSMPQLGRSPLGSLMAHLLDETADPAGPVPPIVTFLDSMLRGDLDAARSAVESMPPQHTVYKSDLLTLIDRPDATSKGMALATRSTALALVALHAGLPQIAAKHSAKAMSDLPGMALAYSLNTEAQLSLNLPTDRVLDLVAKHLPNSSLAIYLQAREKMTDQDFEGEIEELRRLLEREPDHVHLRYKLAQALQRNQQSADAIELLEEIYAANGPYKQAAANDLAYIVSEEVPERLEEAYTMAVEILKMSPNSPVLQDTVGWIEHLRGNDIEALDHLQKAVVGLRRLPEVHYHLGVVYQALGNQMWAYYHLSEAAASDSDKKEVGLAKDLLKGLSGGS